MLETQLLQMKFEKEVEVSTVYYTVNIPLFLVVVPYTLVGVYFWREVITGSMLRLFYFFQKVARTAIIDMPVNDSVGKLGTHANKIQNGEMNSVLPAAPGGPIPTAVVQDSIVSGISGHN